MPQPEREGQDLCGPAGAPSGKEQDVEGTANGRKRGQENHGLGRRRRHRAIAGEAQPQPEGREKGDDEQQGRTPDDGHTTGE